MPDYRDEFGAFVRESLRGQNAKGESYSNRDVERLSRGRVSRSTVQSMSAGAVPLASDLVIEFALAVGVDPNEALRRAGRPWVRFEAKERELASSHRSPLFGAVCQREALATA